MATPFKRKEIEPPKGIFVSEIVYKKGEMVKKETKEEMRARLEKEKLKEELLAKKKFVLNDKGELVEVDSEEEESDEEEEVEEEEEEEEEVVVVEKTMVSVLPKKDEEEESEEEESEEEESEEEEGEEEENEEEEGEKSDSDDVTDVEEDDDDNNKDKDKRGEEEESLQNPPPPLQPITPKFKSPKSPKRSPKSPKKAKVKAALTPAAVDEEEQAEQIPEQEVLEEEKRKPKGPSLFERDAKARVINQAVRNYLIRLRSFRELEVQYAAVVKIERWWAR